MSEEKLNHFNEFYRKNYKYLVSFSKSINPQNDFESLAHDAFLRCRDRIATNGFLGDNYLNYTRCAIMNLYKSQYRHDKKKIMVDIEDQDYYSYIENKLLNNEDQEIQDEEKYHKDIFLTAMIYEYIDKYCTPKEVFIFKSYFLLKHKHLNYKQLAEATGYSLTTVSNTIKKVKKQLQVNIRSYINTGKEMNETLLAEVADILSKDANTYWRTYLDIYKKIFGVKYSGCRCKGGTKLKVIIEEWYKKNKIN